MSTPVHPIPLPGRRPWKSYSLERDLLAVPAGSLPAVVMEPNACPSYGLVAYLQTTGVPWLMPDGEGGLEDAPRLPLDPASPLQGSAVAVKGRILHPASHATVIGDYTANMLAAFGARPEHSGSVEPLSTPWNSGDLTQWARGNMPWSARVFSGDHLAGLLTVSRTEGGVMESFDALVSNGHPVTAELLDAVLDQAHSLRSVDFIAELHFGADRNGIRSGGDQYRVPLAALLGPELAKDRTIAPYKVPGADIRKMGSRPFLSYAVRFPLVGSWDGGAGQELRRAVFPDF